MQQSKLPLDLNISQEQTILGEYQISHKLNVASDIFQVDDESSSSTMEQIDEQLVAVHVSNERYELMTSVTSMDSQHISSIPLIDLQPDEPTISTSSPTFPRIPHKRSLNAKRK